MRQPLPSQTSGLALTDAKGKATVGLSSGLTPGEGEATVTFGDYKISLKFVVVREDISVSLILITGQSWLDTPNEPAKWEKLNSIRQANSPARRQGVHNPVCRLGFGKYFV